MRSHQQEIVVLLHSISHRSITAAKTEVPQRNQVYAIAWNVVQEQEPVCHSKKQEESRITRMVRKQGLRIHRTFDARTESNFSGRVDIIADINGPMTFPVELT